MKPKCIVFIACLCILIFESNAQMLSDTLKKNDYKIDAGALIQKSKSQKTGAWLLISAGAVMAMAGLAITTENATNEFATAVATGLTLGFADIKKPPQKGGGTFLAVAGTTTMAASIPLFTASARNKRKANAMN